MEQKIKQSIDKINQYLCVQKNHWQCMCDLSDNDYNIDYFSGRYSVCDDAVTLIRQEGNIDELLEELMNKKVWIVKNVFWQGYKDELELIIKMINQNYNE